MVYAYQVVARFNTGTYLQWSEHKTLQEATDSLEGTYASYLKVADKYQGFGRLTALEVRPTKVFEVCHIFE